jgi:LysR family malonate utilization transcriptional regulator
MASSLCLHDFIGYRKTGTRQMNKQIGDEITFRKLEIFLAFMENGNLAKTAERLGMSNVSVHKALHSLEEGLRCALFRHSGRNLIPTEAAEVLAKVSINVLDSMRNGIEATREAAGLVSDKLRVGSIYSLTAQMLPRIFIDMRSRRPTLSTEFVLGPNSDLTDKLKRGQVDATLMAILSTDPEIETVELFEDIIYFAAPAGSSYAGRASIGLDCVRDELFVALGGGFATSKGFHEAFQRAGYTPRIAMEVGDIFTVMNLVKGGIGYSLLPGRVRNMFGDQIQFIPLEERFQIRQTIGLCFIKARERDPNLLALAAACRMVRKHQLLDN